MNDTTERYPEPNAMTCFIIYGTLTFATFIYVGIAYFMEMSRVASKIAGPKPPPAFAMITGSVAAVSIVAAILWMLVRTKGRVDTPVTGGDGVTRMSPQEMQTDMIVSLALAEVSAIGGLIYFFSGGPASSILPYAAATLVVDLFVILPILTRYWKKGNDEIEGPQVTVK